ncbi:hypothetical protein HMPREF9151_01528 [Hoylesella saccharolytica F0055]|uniref:Uncharacterized protein n=1 Tax=Hoylesella saccharolytica F0055 TaxID=1127699 RepID=L1N8Y5_9BACT|nr:hypothetical protein HMPREF9151_01528 [Hoylesella saccharolytica F0055]
MLHAKAITIITTRELALYENIAMVGVQKQSNNFLFLCFPLQVIAAIARAIKPNNKERMANSTPQDIKVNNIPMCNDAIYDRWFS